MRAGATLATNINNQIVTNMNLKSLNDLMSASVMGVTGITEVNYLGFSAVPDQGDQTYLKLERLEDLGSLTFVNVTYRVALLINGETLETLNEKAFRLGEQIVNAYGGHGSGCIAGGRAKLASEIVFTDPIGFTEDDFSSSVGVLQMGIAFEITIKISR
jgi:hypothetical protein